MPQLTLDIIQTPENAFAIHPQNQLLFFFFLSPSLFLLVVVWHIVKEMWWLMKSKLKAILFDDRRALTAARQTNFTNLHLLSFISSLTSRWVH